MRGIDTNVVVRFLTNDDKRQAKAARAAIEAGDIFITTTVMLESEWVLRSGYGFTPERIVTGLRGLARLTRHYGRGPRTDCACIGLDGWRHGLR